MPLFESCQGIWLLEKTIKTIKTFTQWYSVNVTYPEYYLSGQPIQDFNTAVAGEVTGFVEDFTDTAKQLALPEERRPDLKGSHFTYTAVNRVITAKIDLYPYLGGAHPGHQIITAAFDTTANTAIILSDLFVPGSRYLERLSTLAEEALFTKYPELGFAFNAPTYREGFAPRAENFSHWALTDAGLIIFFIEYQIAPYAAGALEVEIPFEAIADIIMCYP